MVNDPNTSQKTVFVQGQPTHEALPTNQATYNYTVHLVEKCFNGCQIVIPSAIDGVLFMIPMANLETLNLSESPPPSTLYTVYLYSDIIEDFGYYYIENTSDIQTTTMTLGPNKDDIKIEVFERLIEGWPVYLYDPNHSDGLIDIRQHPDRELFNS